MGRHGEFAKPDTDAVSIPVTVSITLPVTFSVAEPGTVDNTDAYARTRVLPIGTESLDR